jgi:hypothetical protein
MPGIVASNQSVNEALVQWLDLIDFGGACRLRIFSNDFTPTPGSDLSTFTEANFDGYAAKDPTGTWGVPFKVLNGLYQSDGQIWTWTGATTANQTVYGWYIDDGTFVYLSRRFNAPILVLPDVVFSVQIFPQTIATSLLE